jgi:uncharacterized membrane protein YraQ (UPF0718 family)
VGVIDVIWHGARDAVLMAWEVWWALVLGFGISAVVQAWVPRERVQAALGSGGAGAVSRATLLGAASSSCSYAAVAIGRSLMQKGASVAAAFAFAFASTNLVWELGLVLWALIGWQFTVAEYVGGLVMIALMALLTRAFIGGDVEREARERLAAAAARDDDHCDHHNHDHGAHGAHAQTAGGWRERLSSPDAWRAVGQAFLADWRMLWKEIAVGFVLAGFIAQVPNSVFGALFIHHAPAPLPALENALVGPLIAIASFVCSVGNVPLAAVLWSGGISFSGVIAFLFADLLVIPIIAIYRRAYGARFTVRIVALMFVTMVLAALVVTALFHGLGWIPQGPRPGRRQVFGSIAVDHTLVLNAISVVVFAALAGLTRRPRAPDQTAAMVA